MKNLAVFIVVAGTLAAAAPARAELIEFTFGGLIESIDSGDRGDNGLDFNLGSPWVVRFTFDSETPLDPAPPDLGNPDATYYPAMLSYEVMVGGLHLVYDTIPENSDAYIVVADNLSFDPEAPVDGFASLLYDYDIGINSAVELLDFDALAFSDESLPTDLSLASFQENAFLLTIESQDGTPRGQSFITAFGSVEFFSRRIVPAPGAAAAFLGAGLILAGRRRR